MKCQQFGLRVTHAQNWVAVEAGILDKFHFDEVIRENVTTSPETYSLRKLHPMKITEDEERIVCFN